MALQTFPAISGPAISKRPVWKPTCISVSEEALLIPGVTLATSPWPSFRAGGGYPTALGPCWQTCCSLFSSNKKQDVTGYISPWILWIGWLRDWDSSGGGNETRPFACWEKEGLCNKEADAISPCSSGSLGNPRWAWRWQPGTSPRCVTADVPRLNQRNTAGEVSLMLPAGKYI